MRLPKDAKLAYSKAMRLDKEVPNEQVEGKGQIRRWKVECLGKRVSKEQVEGAGAEGAGQRLGYYYFQVVNY